MSDNQLFTSQLVNGVAVLLSFFVGYKYALKRHDIKDGDVKEKEEASGGGNDANAGGDNKVYANAYDEYKMVLVVRNDIKMGKGKIAAQCGHGAVGAYQKAVERNPRLVRIWENSGCAKIALKIESEEEMMLIKRKAEAHNLTTCLIRVAGRTQIEPNTKTVLAIGPASVFDIDKITGHLKLL